MKVLNNIFSIAKPYKFKYLLLTILYIIDGIVVVAIPFVTRSLIDDSLANHNQDLLITLALSALGLTIISIITGYVEMYTQTYNGEKIIFDLRTKLFNHIQKMPYLFFVNAKTSKILDRIERQPVDAQYLFTTNFSILMKSLIQIGFVIGSMIAISLDLSLVVISLLPLFFIPTQFLVQKMVKASSNYFKYRSTSLKATTESITPEAIKLSKTFGTQNFTKTNYKEKSFNIMKKSLKRLRLVNFNGALMGFLVSIFTIIIYLFGGLYVLYDQLTIGSLVAIIAFIGIFYNSFSQLSNVYVMIRDNFVVIGQIFETFDIKTNIVSDSTSPPLSKKNNSVSFKNVSFSYPDIAKELNASIFVDTDCSNANTTIFKDISFTIPGSSKVGIIGPTGTGKSTLCGLLSRLYDPTTGEVLIGDQNLKNVALESIPEVVSVVSQESFVFHDTIANNLKYVKPDSTEEELFQVLKRVKLFDFINNLPNGINSVVGESGSRLSGGERQRLSIARALLKNTPIIILDEATASLDSETEAAIQTVLEDEFKDKTMLLVAHRLSTLKHADYILTLENGTMSQFGKNEVIRNCDGYYKNMLNINNAG
jgi:ATP-binding cassette subfamily B protein